MRNAFVDSFLMSLWFNVNPTAVYFIKSDPNLKACLKPSCTLTCWFMMMNTKFSTFNQNVHVIMHRFKILRRSQVSKSRKQKNVWIQKLGLKLKPPGLESKLFRFICLNIKRGFCLVSRDNRRPHRPLGRTSTLWHNGKDKQEVLCVQRQSQHKPAELTTGASIHEYEWAKHLKEVLLTPPRSVFTSPV